MSDEQVEPETVPTHGIDQRAPLAGREAAAGHPGLEDALRRLEALYDSTSTSIQRSSTRSTEPCALH